MPPLALLMIMLCCCRCRRFTRHTPRRRYARYYAARLRVMALPLLMSRVHGAAYFFKRRAFRLLSMPLSLLRHAMRYAMLLDACATLLSLPLYCHAI